MRELLLSGLSQRYSCLERKMSLGALRKTALGQFEMLHPPLVMKRSLRRGLRYYIGWWSVVCRLCTQPSRVYRACVEHSQEDRQPHWPPQNRDSRILVRAQLELPRVRQTNLKWPLRCSWISLSLYDQGISDCL